MKMQKYERNALKRLRKFLPECTLFLKKNGAFPLEKAGKIALFGNGVRSTIKGGTGSGEVNSRWMQTIERGLEKAGFEITTKAWLAAYENVYRQNWKKFVKEIKERARRKHTPAMFEGMGAIMPEPEYEISMEGEGEAAVYVLSRISGEGSDRNPAGGDILLTESEKRMIHELSEKYPKFMLVLNVGGPVDLTPVLDVPNILLLSQLGDQIGFTLADILLGRENPSGKLATTWSAWSDYPELIEIGDPDDTWYKEGIYVGYRYFDTVGKDVQFPFGFGLSYTDFTLEQPSFVLNGQQMEIQVTVTNTGAYAGKEVVQVYAGVPEGELDQPYQALAGWVKTSRILPGASETVSVSISMSELASFDTKRAAWILEAGTYRIFAGNSSRNTALIGKVIVEETIIVKQAANKLGETDFEDWKPKLKQAYPEDCEVPVYTLDAAAISPEIISYDRKEEVAEEVLNLSDEELAYLNIGRFNPKGGLLNVVGNASASVAGAAGESAIAGGFAPLVMADGPAGLRLTPEYYEDEKGIHGIGSGMPETMAAFLPAPAVFMMKLMGGKAPKDVPVQTQYATALPIGTAIAQSWNLEFAKACGDIVGSEMQRFGVHLWLAPALNIHRSIRCGRNFEYYSEDPLISGKMAAAITNGVQQYEGCGTTIKHYAANNQETNRYANNSIVSERAMREIYLRGFDICVRESQPKAVMTSYNLINGVHTSESRELTEDILRCESGFKGLVMTDWVIAMMVGKDARYKAPQAYKVAAAGGDLFMPGSKEDYDNLLHALKDGRIERAQLEKNASRLWCAVKELTENE